jgi:hypothetical protein
MDSGICQDELTPIATYMASEINTSSRSALVRRIKSLNAVSAQGCINDYLHAPLIQRLFALSPQECTDYELGSREAAMLLWTCQVMQNAEWDHKPKIRAKFVSRITGSGVWRVRDDTKYFYDVWSNVHYGYVGRVAGFSESILLDGAGLEQIGSMLVKLKQPIRSPRVNGLRAFDDPPDRAAITIGVKLYAAAPFGSVTAGQLLDEILAAPDIERRQL